MKRNKGLRRFSISALLTTSLLSGFLSCYPDQLQTAHATVTDEWTELQSTLSGIKGQYTTPPTLSEVVTNNYTAGLLLGNGDIGVVSDARNEKQTFYFSKSDFWDSKFQKLTIGGITISTPKVFVLPYSTSSSDTSTISSTSNAFDGNIETKWESLGQNVSSGDKWLTVDLQQPKLIDRWVVKNNGYPNRASNYQQYNSRDYKLQKSDDKTTWTDVDTVVGNTAESTNRSVPAFTARYVRLYITKLNQPTSDKASNGSEVAMIREFELYSNNVPIITSVTENMNTQIQNI